MDHLSSIVFWLFINAWGTVLPILYFPVFIIKNSSKLADHGALIWARLSLFALKKFCKIDHKILGLENLPTPCIIACKHQSMWETIVMHLVCHRPAYSYKQELLHVPFYGWYLTRMTGIKVNRKGGAAALRSIIKQAQHYLKNNHNIVIFPQGTRVSAFASTEKYPYQSGIAALYLSCNVPVVPAALNSGIFWPKHKTLKKSGTITLEFLEPIYPGLSKEEFLQKLEDVTEKRSIELCKEAEKGN